MQRELIAASTESLILSLLAKEESYGYALIQSVRQLSGNQVQWSDGMLYPVLHRLEREGLIKSEWKDSGNGRKRKYYSIEKSGRSVLAESAEQWRSMFKTLSLAWSGARV